jgi:hypothetical protein
LTNPADQTTADRQRAPAGRAPRGRALVLGALSGKRVGTPTVFVESLAASGADADLVVFCCDVANETEQYLVDRGATIIPFRFWRWWHGPIHSWRFALFARYAAEHADEYAYVMTSDLRDVVIQSDPFAETDDPAVNFFLENAAYTIAGDRHYSKWMRRFIPSRFHSAYAGCRLSCCGVVIGGAREMTAYLQAMTRRIATVSLLQRRNIGADSAMHNLIAHVTHDVPGIIAENNGLVATMGLEPEGSYQIGEDGLIRCGDGHVPAICHQYDRIDWIRRRVAEKYQRTFP